MPTKQTLIQEIDTLPPNLIDDMLQYVSFLKFKASKTTDASNAPDVKGQSPKALWDEIEGLYGIVRSDIDENVELAEARDEKYASIG